MPGCTQAPPPSEPTTGDQERIVAAAIQVGPNVFTGPHHAAIIHYVARCAGITPVSGEQGFITNKGRAVSRKLALEIAVAAGQVDPAQCSSLGLLSENLWIVPDGESDAALASQEARHRQEMEEAKRALDAERGELAVTKRLFENITQRAEAAEQRAESAEIELTDIANGSLAHRALVAEQREREAGERLPEGMKHCTILFKECQVGHGRLTAMNWIDHGCDTCALAAAGEREKVLREALRRHMTTHGCDFVDADDRTCRDCDEARAALAAIRPAPSPVSAPPTPQEKCWTCGGYRNDSGTVCICGGTYLHAVEVQNMREELMRRRGDLAPARPTEYDDSVPPVWQTIAKMSEEPFHEQGVLHVCKHGRCCDEPPSTHCGPGCAPYDEAQAASPVEPGSDPQEPV